MPGSTTTRKPAKKAASKSKSATSARGKKSKAKTTRSRQYPCIGDAARKHTTKGRSPKSRGLCPKSLPINTVATGSDDQQYIVMLDRRGEHIWEKRRYPSVYPRTPFDDFFRAPPTVNRLFGGA